MPGTMRRDLVIGVDAETGKAEQGFQRTTRSTSSYERELRKLERQQAKVDAAMEKVGTGMLVAGAAIAAGLGLAVKAAIDWESSWAGVLKTVDGTDEQMAALEEEIRGLTAVLPASHAEIAAVAEAAGQLGIQRENVAAFTKTMIDMGEATNLTSDAAATALARLMNIMQTAPDDVDRLSSAIVDLGNKGATTEAEITEMALRIAGAGRTIGLSEQQVLAFAAALSNVGIRAEAGGTAISKVFLEIDTAVTAGGASLDTFAATAGMSADQFRRAYEQDAGAAIASFVQGLARVQESGGDVNAILADLGLTEIRVSDALRRLAGSGDNLTTALSLSNEAWEENSALTEEAERRYQTAEARIAIARNQINDFAIDMGSVFLPAVAESADALGGFVDFVSGMPDPLRSAVAILAAITAGVLLLGGTALVTIPKIHAFNASLDAMAVKGGRAAAASRLLRLSMRALGPVAVGLVAVEAGSTALSNVLFDDLNPNLEATVTGLRRLAEGEKLAGESLRVLRDQVGGTTNEMDRLLSDAWWDKAAVGIQDFVGMGPSFTDTFTRMAFDLEKPREQIEAIDQALASLAQESPQQAEEAFARLTQEMGLSEEQTRQLRGQLDQWRAAAEVGEEQTQDTAEGMEEVGGAAQEAAEDIEELQEAFDDLFGAFMSLDRAQISYKEGLVELVEALDDGASSLSLNSQAGRDNRSAVLDQIEAISDLRQANIDNGMSLDDANEKYENQLGAVERMLIKRGFEEGAVRDLIDSYRDIPDAVSTTVSTPGLAAAEAAAERMRRRLANIDRFVNIHFNVTGQAPVGSFRLPFQHGGEVEGPAGIDQVPIAATRGEIMIRQPVAQMHREQLLALNQTGRWPVNPGGQQMELTLRYVFESRGTELDRLVQQSVERGMRTNSAFRKTVHSG